MVHEAVEGNGISRPSIRVAPTSLMVPLRCDGIGWKWLFHHVPTILNTLFLQVGERENHRCRAITSVQYVQRM
jgi:hypothetical protein